MILLLCLCGLFSQSFAQLVSLGWCPHHSPLSDFDPDDILGHWYEGFRIKNSYQPDHQCGKAVFYKDDDGYLVDHIDSIVPVAGVGVFWNGKHLPKDDCKPGEYYMKFASYATDPGVDVTFTDADWDSWVIQYGCIQRSIFKHEYIWVYVKDPNTCDVKAIAKATGKLGIWFDCLMKIDHDHCPKDTSRCA